MARVAIPHWMAQGVGPKDEPVLLGYDEAGARFGLCERAYLYGRWGLEQTD